MKGALDKLTVKGFKSIKDLHAFKLDDLNIIIGANGASTFERLKEEDFSQWLEDYSVGELWSKNVIAGGPMYE
jgi:predicted ATPase